MLVLLLKKNKIKKKKRTSLSTLPFIFIVLFSATCLSLHLLWKPRDVTVISCIKKKKCVTNIPKNKPFHLRTKKYAREKKKQCIY